MMASLRKLQKPGVVCPKDCNPTMDAMESTVMTQMVMKKGIKTFGQAGVDAVQKELKQLHNKEVTKPMHAHEISSEQRRT